jgi:hypothetical protein
VILVWKTLGILNTDEPKWRLSMDMGLKRGGGLALRKGKFVVCYAYNIPDYILVFLPDDGRIKRQKHDVGQ